MPISAGVVVDQFTGNGNTLYLEAKPDGGLLLAGTMDTTIYNVDPVTGAKTTFATLPAGYTGVSDLAIRSDGSYYAIATNTNGDNVLLSISADGSTVTEIASLPFFAVGITVVGDKLVVTDLTGTISTVPLSSIPTTASTAPLQLTTLVDQSGTTRFFETTTASTNCVAELTLTKTADKTTVSTVGETVTYTFQVTNAGNVALQGVTVTEGTFTGAGTLSSVTPATADIPAGGTAVFTATYTVTQADIDNGGTIDNTATASGTTVDGTAVVVGSDPSTATLTVAPVTPPTTSPANPASPSNPANPAKPASNTGAKVSTGGDVAGVNPASVALLAGGILLLGALGTVLYRNHKKEQKTVA